jgi:hypothetical protein
MLHRTRKMNGNAEEIRLKYFYRQLILRGKVIISWESARKLVGPDCAFHLYSIMDFKKKISPK